MIWADGQEHGTADGWFIITDLEGRPVAACNLSNWAIPGRQIPGFARFVELADDLYAIHATGGPLHVVLDDGNVDGTIRPWYDGFTPTELDAVYYQGWPLADLDPAAPAVVEGLGLSTRQLCDEIASQMNCWTVEERTAAVALWRGRRPS